MLLNSEKSLAGRSVCALLLTGISLVAGADFAAPFTNLDFEQATIPPGTPAGTVSAAAAFPGWTVRIGNVETSEAYFDYDGIGEPFVALYDRSADGLGISLLQNKFMAIVATGADATGSTVAGSLFQVGDVPSEARSIRLFADGFRGPPQVLLNESPIELVRLSGRGHIGEVAEFGGDIPSYAGTSATLRLQSGLGLFGVDGVWFSSEQIPEPASGTACMAAGALLGFRWSRAMRIS